MRQKAFYYESDERLLSELNDFRSELSGSANMFFHVQSTILDYPEIERVCRLVQSIFPETPWIGNSTSGNIVDCEDYEGITISAQIFEDETTRFKILQYSFADYSPSEIAAILRQESALTPWLKAIEIYRTITSQSATDLCTGLSVLKEDIQVFGGIVCNTDITDSRSFVFSSDYGMCTDGVLIVFYGGENFHVRSVKISGWKPIGRNFLVTRASGSTLYELGGVPAYEIYKKYLNIRNDDNFFYNALDFPMMYEHNNTTIVRAASRSNADGSISLSSDVEVGEVIRLSYGDPQTILASVREECWQMQAYEPDIVHIFSCAARKAYWAPYKPTYEIQDLKGIASCTGFFSHGEFVREGEFVNQHNVTLVLASMREGQIEKPVRDSTLKPKREGRLPLAARMATFIRETTYELEEMNGTLQEMNRQLEGLASTDSLTGLKNRLVFNELMKDIQANDQNKNWYMLMMDVNGLKYTNDTFGHLAGDELIIAAANAIRDTFDREGQCFRIGGDEFSVVIDASMRRMHQLMKEFRTRIEAYNKVSLHRLSIAVGDSRLRDGLGDAKSISDWKMDADLSMYRDKALRQRLAAENPEVQNHKELIRCMISMEEAKDTYTAHHSERVCALSETIARLLGLTDITIQIIRDAAHLHDIGKVGVSDAILLKPTALTHEEFEKIKEHPVIGARILMQSNYTQELVQIVLHHHERFDGAGYPNGLAGFEIPIGARIVALADSIDAMTSKRIYRDAMTAEKCYEEIERNLGRMYDPAIGKVVLENWETVIASLGNK